MRLYIETWIDSQSVSTEALSTFKESFRCYRMEAHKAALLFGYLGFMTVLKDRILLSQCPTGFSPARFTAIQGQLRQDETWDAKTFDATQQKDPAPVFPVSDDLRHQIRYWKDRRNDCAHSKDNQITAAHVEALYAFIESNLGKLCVAGSRSEMKRRVLGHFDPSMTPPGSDVAPLVREIPSAVPAAEMLEFVSEIARAFDDRDGQIITILDMESEDKLTFLNACVTQGDGSLQAACAQLLMGSDRLCASFLRRHTDKAQLLSGRPEAIRRLWHDFLFRGYLNDFPLFSSLIRLRLIPEAQRREACRHVIKRGIAGVPNTVDSAVLEDCGFFVELEDILVNGDEINSFDWANTSKELIVKYISEHPMSQGIARCIYRNFNSANFPWHLAEMLDGLFRANAGKRAEYLTLKGAHEDIGIPSKIPSLSGDG